MNTIIKSIIINYFDIVILSRLGDVKILIQHCNAIERQMWRSWQDNSGIDFSNLILLALINPNKYLSASKIQIE